LRQAYDYWQNQPDCYFTLVATLKLFGSKAETRRVPKTPSFGVIYTIETTFPLI